MNRAANDTALEVRRYIGHRIQSARKYANQSQAAFADRLAEYTDQEWSRAMVTNLETGAKRIDVELLCAIAVLQDRQVSWYFADAPSSLGEAIPG